MSDRRADLAHLLLSASELQVSELTLTLRRAEERSCSEASCDQATARLLGQTRHFDLVKMHSFGLLVKV